jgi:hypothetical protein
MPQELNAILESEAKDRGISTSALVSSIAMKFAQWGRYADKYGTICISQDIFKILIGSISEEKIAKIAEQHGGRIITEEISFWFKERSVKSLLLFLENHCRYAGYGNFEFANRNQEYEIRVQHALGKNWSLFLANCLRYILQRIGPTAEFQISETGVGAVLHTCS